MSVNSNLSEVKFGLSLFFLLLFRLNAPAEETVREILLQGEWRFEIGDNLDYCEPNFDDSHWEKIEVPGAWENEGFPGYDGYAWYRITFHVPRSLRNKNLILKLGQIDDVDRAYFNGKSIGGEGDFPPKYKTAYDVFRAYEIPTNFVNFDDENVLSLRVFDLQGSGGVVRGDVGIYSKTEILNLKVDLSGMWNFRPGDRPEWAGADFDDSGWRMIPVPGYWEQQGFPNLDGYAWYRKYIRLSGSLVDKKLILILGKINDVDEVFFNGVQIGGIGRVNPESDDEKNSFRNLERAYFIPPYLLQANATNTIAVRVHDFSKKGGIYAGYIGITTRDEFLRYSRRKRQPH